MFQPRNSLVSVKLLPKQEERVGLITVPTAHNEYCEAEVISVGPGDISSQGGRSETFDLSPGLHVIVKFKDRRNSQHGPILVDAGLPFRDGDTELHLFEQSSIVAIVS